MQIPFTSAKHDLRPFLTPERPHLIAFHKADLANPRMQAVRKMSSMACVSTTLYYVVDLVQIVKKKIERRQGTRVHFCSSHSNRQMKQVSWLNWKRFQGAIMYMSHFSWRQQLRNTLEDIVPPMYGGFAGTVLAILGVPNAGKSTIINSLRHSSKQFKTKGMYRENVVEYMKWS